MLLLNFARSLNDEQCSQLEALTGKSIERTIHSEPLFDPGIPYEQQAPEFLDSLNLTVTEWQQAPIVVNPPGLSVLCATVLAAIHGRRGNFPAVLRLKPVETPLGRTFEVAEILKLQSLRESAHKSSIARVSNPPRPPDTRQPAAPVAAKDSTSGLLAGRYRLGAELGRGAMGTVYLARDLNLNRDVAIKFLQRWPTRSETDRRRFQNEKTAARVHHSGICAVYDFSNDDQQGDYLVMEYIAGQSLSDLLRQRRLSPREAVLMTIKLARTLQAAHDAGVIHRDLKPANILLTVSGEPKITDFGISLDQESDRTRMTQDGQPVGTPLYMAPEVVRGEVLQHTAAVDIFSLGAVFYEMLSGKRPFPGPGIQKTFEQIKESEPVPLCGTVPGVDERLAEISRMSLAKRVEDRFASMRQFAEALESIIDSLEDSDAVGLVTLVEGS